MCGFAGFVGYGDLGDKSVLSIAGRMGKAIVHRGPDDSGIWHDKDAQVALVHQRLSILDLSPAGHQPMISPTGRYVIVFNGEFYNHLEIRSLLDRSFQPSQEKTNDTNWRGHSDTETLLAAIEKWGINKTLKQVFGMFAFALWDRQSRTLTLARDRMGEKPLYYGTQKDVFLFASELKALKAHPEFDGAVNRDALCLQLRHNYIPAPYSIYKSVKKLPPGTFLQINIEKTDEKPQPYWSFAEISTGGVKAPFTGDDESALASLESLLKDATKKQMISDVPLGAFLSGGVDSSTIVALMQAQSSHPVKTFTIGFTEAEYNEAVHAKAVARYLGTEHTELYVSPTQAMEVIPRLPTLYDEPFSDSSQIPTFLVSQMTREHVTVSLSGDAGDELFGGYHRYFLASRLWGAISRLPSYLSCLAANSLTRLRPDQWNLLLNPIKPLLPAKWRIANIGDKFHKSADVLNCKSLDALYCKLVSHWDKPNSIVIDGKEPSTILSTVGSTFAQFGGIEQMMALDSMTYLPDDILTKVDRAAMGVSLETRVPYLDPRVIEFAWHLPLHMKIRNGQGKWILRQLLYKYVPKKLIERPKTGFAIPIDSWLRGPLREWAENLLDESRLRQEGFFKPEPIRKKWNEHLSCQRNWRYHLWDVLMFQAWLEKERCH